MYLHGVISLALLWGNHSFCLPELISEDNIPAKPIIAVLGSGHGGTRCGLDEYQCENGQCVKTRFVCDGIIRCKDGSDESTCESLSLKLLPQNGFLRRISRQSGNQPLPTCLVPPQPEHGRWQLNDRFCRAEPNCNIPQGVFVPRDYELLYSCDSLFRLKGDSRVVCQSSGNWTAIPECTDETKVKCESLNSASTVATCYRDSKEVNCDGPVSHGTTADLFCKFGYKEDIESSVQRRDYVTCGSDGEWNPKPIKCTPVCGTITAPRKLSASNNTTSLYELPWHASLYEDIGIFASGVSKKKFVCGATIIHTRLILSAAHCVYDPRTRFSSIPSQLHVMAGNVVEDYDSPSHDSKMVQKSTVRNVYIHCPYQHESADFENDMALLVLYDPFEFSDIVKPACLDVSGINSQIIGPGAFGMYSSFGISKVGTATEFLKTSTIPWISNAECRAVLRSADDLSRITEKTFCAGPEIGTSVCRQNGGSGLVFQNKGRWYLMGVATVGFSNAMENGKCDEQAYTLYTKVANHIEWIKNSLYTLKYSTYTTPCDHHCSPLTSNSTIATCLLSGNWTACDSLVPPNTKARVSCRAGYMMVNQTNGREHTECKTNGKWDPEPMQCVLDINESPSGPSTMMITQDNALKLGKIRDLAEMNDSKRTILEPIGSKQSQSTNVGTIAAQIFGKQLFEYDTEVEKNSWIRYDESSFCKVGAFVFTECAEYAQHVLKKSSEPGAECAYNQTSGNLRVIGQARIEKFPYMAAFGFKNGLVSFTWFCFGTLVSESFVISVAACVPNEVRNSTWIRVGIDILSQEKSGAYSQYRRITKIIPHPDWSPPAYYHGIGLFKMESPVVLGNLVVPACLHTRHEIETPTVIRTGWHFAADVDRMRNYINLRAIPGLKEVKLDIIDQQRCNASLYGSVSRDSRDQRISNFLRGLPRGIVDDWIICVGHPRGSISEITGIGDPIVIHSTQSSCMYELVGVTMFNYLPTLKNNQGFVRISNYVSWLEKNIWLDG